MIEKLLIKLRRYDTVSEKEEQALRSAMSEVVTFDRGRAIIKAKTEVNASSLLLEGFVHRYKDLESGARQTLQLALPGDFIDLHSLLLKELDHDIGTLTNCRIARFPHDRLRALVSDHDHLGRLLWLSTIVDASIHREWMLSLGRRTASSRLAHLMCELKVRLETAELTEGLSYELPLTQTELAEILGLTPVHINRMLKELRETGVVTIRNRMIEIADWDGLVALAEFDSFYLSLQQRPR